MQLLNLTQLKRLQQAVYIKRLLYARINTNLDYLARNKHIKLVKSRTVSDSKLLNICYAYNDKQNKDIGKDKLLILPFEYFNHPIFTDFTLVTKDSAYSKVDVSSLIYLKQIDELISFIDTIINTLIDNKPTDRNEILLLDNLIKDDNHYTLVLQYIKFCINKLTVV